MPSFKVSVIIENKPEINDPEGETILHDLVLKGNNSSVKKIRSAKMLKFEVDTKNKKIAEKTVMDLCNEFRIYNPLVNRITVESSEA